MNSSPEAKVYLERLVDETLPAMRPSPELVSPSRRSFLGKLGGIATVAAAAGAMTTLEPLIAGKSGEALADEVGPLSDQARADASFNLRVNVATNEHNLPLVPHPVNGDEALYADKGASFSKCLSHDNYGRVDLNA